jgi:nucleoside-diphosphate-sugar epimerase
LDIAERVQQRVPAKIVVTESKDPRSYRQNSDKLRATGFEPQYSVDDAIEGIIAKYASGEFVESDRCYTVRWMKHLNL